MTITIPTTDRQLDFENAILNIWHDSHGENVGEIVSSWGNDRVMIMIENALFEGEQRMAATEQGSEMLGNYVRELLQEGLAEERGTLSEILGRSIDSISINVNIAEQLVMIIVR